MAKLLWSEFSYAFGPKSIYWDIGNHGFTYKSFQYVLHLSFVVPLAVLAIGVAWWKQYEQDSGRRTRSFIVLSFVILFFTTSLSAFAWDIFSFGKKVQFAWRLNAVLCLTLLPVIIGIIEAALAGTVRQRRLVLSVGGALVLGTLAFTGWLTLDPEIFDRDNTQRRIEYRAGMAEFTPLHAQRYTANPEREGRNPNNRDWPKAEIVDGQGEIAVRDWRPRYLRMRIDVPSPSRVAIGQFYFPGWAAQRDGTCCLPLTWLPQDGRILVELPRGVHDVELTLKPVLAEWLGRMISGVTLAGLILLSVLAIRRRRRGYLPITTSSVQP